MNKKKLEQRIKELPVNISIGGVALLFGLAERGAVALSEILETGGHSFGRSYSRMNKLKNFWNYYEELKNLHEKSAHTILWRHHKKGLVKKVSIKKKNYYKLTISGFKIVNIIQKQNEDFIEHPWDGKWRMIMFDVPEKNRKNRDWLRAQLLFWEYKPIQKSVFIGKNPLDEDFWNCIVKFNLNQYIHLLTIGEIDDDGILAD